MNNEFYKYKYKKDNFLNNRIRLILFSKILILIIFLYTLIWLGIYIVNLPYFAIKNIIIEADDISINVNMLQEKITKNQYNFFSLSLDTIKNIFEEMPSVKNAQIFRQYPDTFKIVLEKQIPFAVWGETDDNLFINKQGRIYLGSNDDESKTNITLKGNEEEANYILAQYYFFQKLFKSKIIYIEHTAEQNWIIKLANGQKFTLGREDNQTLSKKINFWHKSFTKLQQDIKYKEAKIFDLRYDGFAMQAPVLQDASLSPLD